LQLGLLLQNLGAPLEVAPGLSPARAALKGGATHAPERVGVYLTNALTGWEPPKGPKAKLLFSELEEERDAAEHVKRDVPILVIIGNPPYNSFAGISKMEEERDLSQAYRTTKQAPAPQGQGLNDLYVRFFRMAERRIVEKTGQGVVCLISNYSWLDGLSFTGMRERYLEAFDRIWIDCLNGDKYKTGKLTPEGEPDPSVFSTEFNREGIQVGTAIALLVVGAVREPPLRVNFRHIWGKTKRQQLLDTPSQDGRAIYQEMTPPLELGLPFAPAQVTAGYLQWPLLPELFPISFPGVKTSRDDVVVDIDRERLLKRMEQYFDLEIGHEEMRRISPGAMTSTGRFKAGNVRDQLRKRGFLPKNIVRYCYRPFDVRWLYWEPETKLLDEKRFEYLPHVFPTNLWIEARQKQPMERFDRGYFTRILADNFGNGLSNFFPLFLNSETGKKPLFDIHEPEGAPCLPDGTRLNIGDSIVKYLMQFATMADTPSVFYHTLAILHSPAYRTENSGALRQDWPRIPLPDGKEALLASAALGRQIAALLDTETDVGAVREPPLRTIATFVLESGMTLNESEHCGLFCRFGCGSAADPENQAETSFRSARLFS
jgi:predicted helicase